MRKIKHLKITLLFFTIILTLLSCEKKIDWRMSVSAPQHYGATVEAEYFSDGKSVAAIRGGGSSGWGIGMDGLTSGQSDKKPIPDLVKVNCYSAREGVTYVADIPLPKRELKKLFTKTINDTILWEVNGGTRIIKNNYFDLMCGCAPGGEIVMWISNGKSLEEITRAKGKEIKRESPAEREAYFNKMPPEEQDWIRNNPIPYGTWDHYDKKFIWQPIILADSANKVYIGNGFEISYTDGSYDHISSWDKGGESAYPTPQNWEEVINYNYRKNEKRSIPYFFKVQWAPVNLGESLKAEGLLPTVLLKKHFESGYSVKGEKKNFTRMVFQVFNDKKLTIWLVGDDGFKVLIKETKGDFLY